MLSRLQASVMTKERPGVPELPEAVHPHFSLLNSGDIWNSQTALLLLGRSLDNVVL
ncbi:hypothetical protein EV363DRAFT_1168268 [Boletus edulis]|uniref:Uncharacterized protein n=1 Tax=Boletus edulis BED1 TaxID=1328754 RepID=A0AAD4BHN2_BOLED|nr:hypothetical protein EV363DRAFT_1168268 [Boletus edulis]KAF8429977.1 hypothetical protein L210DRAFT_3562982 [Boletus edulis BED1]